MATSSSSATEPWRARPGCPEHLRLPLERHINRFPCEYLKEPVTGEVFETAEECQERLLVYSMSQGFDIVKGGGGKPSHPGFNFHCVFHGHGTRNWRGLEEQVERDEDGLITTTRQRDLTHVRGTGCGWSCRVSFKSIGKRGASEKGFVLTVKSLEYSGHPLSENPLIFPKHRERLEEFQAAKAQARAHRINTIPYSASRRVLDSEEFGVLLTSKEYYNSVRHKTPSKSDDKTIQGLIFALQKEGFMYETRVEEVDESSSVISRKCIQI